MVACRWPNAPFSIQVIHKAIAIDTFDNPFHNNPILSLKILLSTLIAFIYALYILAYPPKYRKLSILILAIPVAYAFTYHQELAPSYAFCDTFGRFLYIWFAHMSYEVTILEWTPPVVKENDAWRSRVRAAYKVLFDRGHQGMPNENLRHTYSRREFVAQHIWKASYLYILQCIWATFLTYCVVAPGPVSGPDKGIFFRRLPESLNAAEMWYRFEDFWHWCFINMFMYEAYHSVFAVFFVGLGIDEPSEWSMSLFGSVTEAWSVRRYWGKHWHNYIYHSFSSHTKILTRNWLGMKRGHVVTRLVENTIVFAASGLMHSLVRYVHDGASNDYWVISFWYIGQMVPIIIEGVVQTIWRQKKKELGIQDTKWLLIVERVIGYAWVVGFNMWSISKYVHTKDAWRDARMQKMYAEQVAEWERKQELKRELSSEVMGNEELHGDGAEVA
jgi:hypothetical protein